MRLAGSASVSLDARVLLPAKESPHIRAMVISAPYRPRLRGVARIAQLPNHAYWTGLCAVNGRWRSTTKSSCPAEADDVVAPWEIAH